MNSKKILIIDDDEAILEALKIYLEDLGYLVKTNPTAEKILSKIEDFNPDLILLDLLLADKDGLEVAKKIRVTKNIEKIPILIMTAHPSISKRAKEVNINGYIEKPFDVNQLVKVIEKFTERDSL